MEKFLYTAKGFSIREEKKPINEPQFITVNDSEVMITPGVEYVFKLYYRENFVCQVSHFVEYIDRDNPDNKKDRNFYLLGLLNMVNQPIQELINSVKNEAIPA